MKPLIGITADVRAESFEPKAAYGRAVADHGGLPLALISGNAGFDARGVAGIADLIDGLLIPGGGDVDPQRYGEEVSVPSGCLTLADPARSDFETALLREVMSRRKPVLAICYGMQLVNVAFGGTLYQDIGLQVPGALDHRSGAHGITVGSGCPLRFSTGTFRVNSSHHQAIRRPAEGLEAFAVSADGLIEAVFGVDYPFLVGVQWHPERSGDAFSAGLFRSFTGAASASARAGAA